MIISRWSVKPLDKAVVASNMTTRRKRIRLVHEVEANLTCQGLENIVEDTFMRSEKLITTRDSN